MHRLRVWETPNESTLSFGDLPTWKQGRTFSRLIGPMLNLTKRAGIPPLET